MATPSQKIPVTLIPGDGIGPEVTDATLEILEAVGAPFEWERCKAGMAGVDACGDPLPPETLASIRRTRLALKGPLTTPIGGGYRSSNVRLREEFELYQLHGHFAEGPPDLGRSPLTLAMVGLVFGYYAIFSLGLLRWRRREREGAAV